MGVIMRSTPSPGPIEPNLRWQWGVTPRETLGIQRWLGPEGLELVIFGGGGEIRENSGLRSDLTCWCPRILAGNSCLRCACVTRESSGPRGTFLDDFES